jgi:hypothetical protein
MRLRTISEHVIDGSSLSTCNVLWGYSRVARVTARRRIGDGPAPSPRAGIRARAGLTPLPTASSPPRRLPATIGAYCSDWRQFTAWCDAQGVTSLPATAETLAFHLADIAGWASASTVGAASLGRRLRPSGHRGRGPHPATPGSRRRSPGSAARSASPSTAKCRWSPRTRGPWSPRWVATWVACGPCAAADRFRRRLPSLRARRSRRRGRHRRHRRPHRLIRSVRG